MTERSTVCSQCGHPTKPTARYCGACGAHLSTPSDDGVLPIGSLIGHQGRYRITKQLGAGGFGQAYLALDTNLNYACVIKRLIVANHDVALQRQLRERFGWEARLIAALSSPGHENIPYVQEYLPDSDCLVMKHISGRSLADILARRRDSFPEAAALRYVRDICAALVYMHEGQRESVLHRDVKPGNILLEDARDRVWLIDFGLSKASALVLSPSSDEFLQTAGTPGFTPPEQWQGRPEPKSDVYALAVTLLVLLTNMQPQQLLKRGDEQHFPPVRQINTTVSAETERLIQWGTAAEVTVRPTAAKFLAALDVLLQQPTVPAPPAPTPLPSTATLVGRAAELAQLHDQLVTSRLLALTGLAGVGKTTLASALAQGMVQADQVCWHTFRAGEGIEVLHWKLAAFLARHGRDAVWRLLYTAQSVRGQAQPPEMISEYLVNDLQGHGYVLCLDDRHEVDADEQVQQFVTRLISADHPERPHLIITSRTVPPFVPAEARVAVPGLARADAHQLLKQRGLVLDEPLMNTLIQTTEGNPQLLTLAVNALRNTANAAELVSDLTGASNIESYLLHEVDRRLTEPERAVMGAVAVLENAGTRDAIEALLDEVNVRRTLADLQRRHLLNTHTNAQDKVYGQHAMVQTFYYAALSRRERQTLHQRAGDYFATVVFDQLAAAQHLARAGAVARAAALATSDVDELINRGQAHALERLLAALPPAQLDPNQRAAVATGRGEVAALLGEYTLAHTMFQQALAHGATLDTNPAQIEAQARRRRLLALVGERTGRYAEAEADCRNGLLLALPLGLPQLEVARLYAQLAEILLRQSKYDDAAAACRDGLAALPTEPAAPRERALLLQRLATTDGERGHFAAAITALELSLVLARQSNDYVLVALVLNNLGIYYDSLGLRTRARQAFEESLKLKEQIGDVAGRITTMNNIGMVYLADGDPDAALRCFEECRDLSERMGLPNARALALMTLGQLHFEQGRSDQAHELLRQAHTCYAQIGDLTNSACCLYVLGDVELTQGRADAAYTYATQALDLAKEAGSVTRTASALRVQGEALLMQGQLDAAATLLEQAVTLQAQVGDPYDQAFLLAAQAKLVLAQGNTVLALGLAREGLMLAREHHITALVKVLEELIRMLE